MSRVYEESLTRWGPCEWLNMTEGGMGECYSEHTCWTFEQLHFNDEFQHVPKIISHICLGTESVWFFIQIIDFMDLFRILLELHCSIIQSSTLKPVDTIGKCQRPVFSPAVSQHMHKITNLWKFELDWSSELLDNYESKKKHACHTKLCAFRCLISRPQILN